MYYNVHVTRKAESWAAGDADAVISLTEWLAYVANDPEMQLDSQSETPSAPNMEEVLPKGAPGLCVWLA